MGLRADTVQACFMDETTKPTQSTPPPRDDLGSNKPLVIILIVVCLMLSIGLWARHSRAVKSEADLSTRLTTLSNEVIQYKADLSEQKQVNTQEPLRYMLHYSKIWVN